MAPRLTPDMSRFELDVTVLETVTSPLVECLPLRSHTGITLKCWCAVTPKTLRVARGVVVFGLSIPFPTQTRHMLLRQSSNTLLISPPVASSRGSAWAAFPLDLHIEVRGRYQAHQSHFVTH